jgi:hypothetical protein
MPHGTFDRRFATAGIGIGQEALSQAPVLGLSSGGLTAEGWQKVYTNNAIGAIRRWEEVAAKLNPSRDECRTAELEVYWALWSFPAKSFVLDGKRYKGISRVKGLSVSVTPAPEKKRKRGSTGSVDG